MAASSTYTSAATKRNNFGFSRFTKRGTISSISEMSRKWEIYSNFLDLKALWSPIQFEPIFRK